MLGAVIAEHALDVAHAPDQPNVEHEHRHAQDAVDDIPGKRVRIVFAHDKVRDRRRRDDEQHHAQKQPEHHGDGHLAMPEHRVVGCVGFGGIGFRRSGLRDRLSGGSVGRILAHDLERTLGAQAIDDGIGPAEVVFPGKRLVGFRCFSVYRLGGLRLSSGLNGLGGLRLDSARGFFVLVFGIRMHGRDLERLVAEHQRLHHRTAAAHERPVHPAVLVLAARQVMRLLVNAAVGFAHAHGPVILAAHHDALDKRLPSYVGLSLPVLGKRARKIALLLGHPNHASLSGRGFRRSSSLPGSRYARRGRRHRRR